MSEIFYAVLLGTLAANAAIFVVGFLGSCARTLWSMRQAKRFAGSFEALLKSGKMPAPRPIQNEKGEWLADCLRCFPITRPECTTCHGSGSYWTKPPSDHSRSA